MRNMCCPSPSTGMLTGPFVPTVDTMGPFDARAVAGASRVSTRIAAAPWPGRMNAPRDERPARRAAEILLAPRPGALRSRGYDERLTNPAGDPPGFSRRPGNGRHRVH